MIKKISIIGGDLRIVKLAEMLSKDKFEIKTYALEKAENINEIENIKQCDSIEEAVNDIDIIIGPIPFSSDNKKINTPYSEKIILLEELVTKIKNKKVIAGNIKKDFCNLANENGIEIIDLLEREELVVLNTIATAEGAIKIAIEETNRTLHKSKVLVLGFGRVGKILASKLKAIGANVYCEARDNIDFAWIKAYGYESIHLKNLNKEISQFDIIINTIPTIILKEELKYLNKECVLIDLASNPGGIDREIAKKLGLKNIWALSLPGKVAPVTSAEFIKDTIYNVFKEKEIWKEEEI